MIELRYYQKEAVEAVLKFLKEEKGNPVVATPTGSGKSIMIADLIKNLLEINPEARILKLVHTQELIVQNYEKLKMLLPDCDSGICSAGLNQKDTSNQIIFGGVGTVKSLFKQIGHRDYIIIDECHMFSDKDNSMYQKLFKELMGINPNIRMIGFTATNYRLGKGLIVDGITWHSTCYDLTSWRSFNKLIAEGYLCNLIPKLPSNIINTEGISKQKGDFNLTELQERVKADDITRKCLVEMVKNCENRKHWIVFASGVEHSIDCANILNELGIKTIAIHSNLSQDEREEGLRLYKEGYYQCVTNNNILSVGFDFPKIDLIGFLRPTLSPVLWVQALGRGLRVHPDKKDCLVLDFSHNTARLGCVNDVRIPKKKGKGDGEPPAKLCEKCNVYNHCSARICINCGAEFEIKKKITPKLSVLRLIRTDSKTPTYIDVNFTGYNLHNKEGRYSLQVSYFCQGIVLKEWICFEHSGFAKEKAKKWWSCRTSLPFPEKSSDAMKNCDKLIKPCKVGFIFTDKYPKIVQYEFEVNGRKAVFGA